MDPKIALPERIQRLNGNVGSVQFKATETAPICMEQWSVISSVKLGGKSAGGRVFCVIWEPPSGQESPIVKPTLSLCLGPLAKEVKETGRRTPRVPFVNPAVHINCPS